MADFSDALSGAELLNRLPSAVATFDYTTGDVLILNQRFTEQFGYSLGDMPNIRLWWHQMFIDPETSEEIKDHWEQLQQGPEREGGARPDERPLEVRGSIRCKDGSDKHVELRIVFMGRIMAATFTDITREVQMIKELERVVTTDPQTGFRNRKAFHDIFSHQMERARRYHEPLGLVLLRIDTLAQAEGRYGGDVAGRMMGFVSRQITSAVRNCDMAGRTGPEEVSILLPATPTLGVAVVAERIALRIKSTPFFHEGEEIPLAIRMGVAATDDGIQTVGELERMVRETLEAAAAAGGQSL